MNKPCPRCGRMCHSFTSLRGHAVACDKSAQDGIKVAEAPITPHEDAPTVNQTGWIMLCLKSLDEKGLLPESLAGVRDFLQKIWDFPPEADEPCPFPKDHAGTILGMISEAKKGIPNAKRAQREKVRLMPGESVAALTRCTLTVHSSSKTRRASAGTRGIVNKFMFTSVSVRV